MFLKCKRNIYLFNYAVNYWYEIVNFSMHLFADGSVMLTLVIIIIIIIINFIIGSSSSSKSSSTIVCQSVCLSFSFPANT